MARAISSRNIHSTRPHLRELEDAPQHHVVWSDSSGMVRLVELLRDQPETVSVRAADLGVEHLHRPGETLVWRSLNPADPRDVLLLAAAVGAFPELKLVNGQVVRRTPVSA